MENYRIELVYDEKYYRYQMQIYHKGQLIGEHFDRGEPEDNSFTRDYAWVSLQLEEAYALGFKDGKEST